MYNSKFISQLLPHKADNIIDFTRLKRYESVGDKLMLASGRRWHWTLNVIF